MSFFNIVAATNEDTVVAAYEPSKVRSDSYQSEAELEKEFIRLLCEQGYTYLPLHTEDELIANLRSQLEELNHYQFSDTEWRQFFSDVIANPNEHIPEKTRKIQEDNVQVLHRDDGSSKNITLIDKTFQNFFQNFSEPLFVASEVCFSLEAGAKIRAFPGKFQIIRRLFFDNFDNPPSPGYGSAS